MRIAMIGDSITYDGGDTNQESWLHIVRQHFNGSVELMNFGVNGATAMKQSDKSYWDMPEYQQALNAQADAYIIMLGTNDSKKHNWPGSPATYKIDLLNLTNSFKNLPHRPSVFLVLPAPVTSSEFAIDGKVIAEQIVPAVAHASTLTGLQLLDFHTPFNNDSKYFYDGIHPNQTGREKFAALLIQTIEQKIFVNSSSAPAK